MSRNTEKKKKNQLIRIRKRQEKHKKNMRLKKLMVKSK